MVNGFAVGVPALCALVGSFWGVTTRAPYSCAARSAVGGAADGSAGGGDTTTWHRPRGDSTGPDRAGSAYGAAPRLCGADGVPEFELRRQAMGQRLPPGCPRSVVLNRR